MPHHCIVPHCTNRSGNRNGPNRYSFYRLPLHNPPLLKQWLVKIRRENTPLNKNSRVCSAHFKGGKRSGKHDVPVIFSWSKRSRPSPRKRQVVASEATSNNLHSSSTNNESETVLQEVFNNQCLETEEDHDNLVDMLVEQHEPDQDLHDDSSDGGITSNQELVDAVTNTSQITQEDVGIQNAAVMFDSDVQTCTVVREDAEIQATVTTEEASTDINPGLLNIAKHVCTSTDDLNAQAPFNIESIKHDDKAILFYTGFPSYTLLLTCFNFLGPAAAVLCYDKKGNDTEASFVGRPRLLTPINEFFLTLCRLKLGLKEQDLAYRFQIAQSTVSRIITTWLNFMFYKFKEVPIWPSRQSIDHFMPDCFRAMYPCTRCIIDATELFIEMPSNPSAQQLTFSSYKNHNTLKALVGITPSGAVCFISDLYGGNISDKKLTVECGILKLLESGDSIMADRGFTIEDVLPPGVSLNVPPRLNETGQLTENERTTTRRIASVRIHVERAIERIKNYNILRLIPNNMHNSANQMFFVCAMLTNFLPPLVE